MKSILKTAAFVLAVLLTASFLVMPATEASYGGIYDKTVRLHILANSNDEEDQSLKLALRDSLLDYLSPILEDAEGKQAAESILREKLSEIEAFSKEFVENAGSDQAVSVVLGSEFYPTRTYENFSFPAGEYTSLRIFLGAGEGQNWWCVVYPPLCLGISDASGAFEKYSEEEQALLQQKDGGYVVRFAILDLAAKLKKLFRG